MPTYYAGIFLVFTPSQRSSSNNRVISFTLAFIINDFTFDLPYKFYNIVMVMFILYFYYVNIFLPLRILHT